MSITNTISSITADGHVSTNELRGLLAEILDDGEISKPEFAAYCQMLSQVSGHADNSPALGLTTKLIFAMYFLEDEASPGVLTAEEETELNTLLLADGILDEIEESAANFVKTLALQKGQLSRSIMEAPTLGVAISQIAADGQIDDLEAKSLYFRIRKDGSVDDEELAALISLNNKAKGSALWKTIFPVLVLASVVVDDDHVTFELSASEGNILKTMAEAGLDEQEQEAIAACIELAEVVDPDFADWWSNIQAAA